MVAFLLWSVLFTLFPWTQLLVPFLLRPCAFSYLSCLSLWPRCQGKELKILSQCGTPFSVLTYLVSVAYRILKMYSYSWGDSIKCQSGYSRLPLFAGGTSQGVSSGSLTPLILPNSYIVFSCTYTSEKIQHNIDTVSDNHNYINHRCNSYNTLGLLEAQLLWQLV